MGMSPPGPQQPNSSESIDFLCGHCGKLLRVPNNLGGRVVKCPSCDGQSQVPAQVNPSANYAPAQTVLPATGMSNAAQANTLATGDTSVQSAIGTVGVSSEPGLSPVSGAGESQRSAVAPGPTRSSRSAWGRSDTGNETPTRKLFNRIETEIRKIYVGQDELVFGTLVALFSGGHVLIESVPGLGKTLFLRALGRVLGCETGRIQFTADLMPSDITGAPIFDMKTQEFKFRAGPVFTQFLLADEINRSPAKTHAALLEIMQEYRVTVDGTSHTLKRPFFVLATQNPIESEGTYNLPEAQLDRFMFKLVADYPTSEEEADILKMHSHQIDINKRLESELVVITSSEEINDVIRQCSDIRVDDRLLDYINQIVRLTRNWPQVYMGASPRAGLALMQAARTAAAFFGRDYAVPDDVMHIVLPALRHRVMLTAEADVEGHKVDNVLTELIRTIEVPRL